MYEREKAMVTVSGHVGPWERSDRILRGVMELISERIRDRHILDIIEMAIKDYGTAEAEYHQWSDNGRM